MTTTPRLEAARAELATIGAERQELDDQLARLHQNVEPATQDARAADDLQQQRRGIFARLLRLGRPVSDETPELAEIDRQQAAARRRAVDAQAAIEAAREIEAEISAKLTEIGPRIQAAQHELLQAAADAAGAEVEHRVDDVLQALITLRETLASTYGALTARDRLAAQVRGDRFNVEPYPPLRSITLSLPALGMEERLRGRADLAGSNYSHVTLDFGDALFRESAELIARLTATQPAEPQSVDRAQHQTRASTRSGHTRATA